MFVRVFCWFVLGVLVNGAAVWLVRSRPSRPVSLGCGATGSRTVSPLGPGSDKHTSQLRDRGPVLVLFMAELPVSSQPFFPKCRELSYLIF